jgi:predicted nucleic acid-binding protein
MPKAIFLDSSPLSILANPAQSLEVIEITQWVAECDSAGHHIIIPEIVDYEVRRELLRLNKSRSLSILDTLKNDLTYLPLNSAAITKAAELWALTRQQGKPTADDSNIDIDVILAAQIITSGLKEMDAIVATVNLRHLSLFVAAEHWRDIDI